MAPGTLRDLSTLAVRGDFRRDELQIEYFTEGRTTSFGGHVVSTGEQFGGLHTDLVGLETLRELSRSGRLEGHRAPVYYLPATGLRSAIDNVNRFRVQSPEQFESAGSLGRVAANIAIAAIAAVLLRRGVAK